MAHYIGSFKPANYSDVPLYNIQAVSAATGVPSITLRSWERRYGVPEPRRDVKGYRLYSERDIAVARWLRERVQQGVGISRAVHMLRLLEGGTDQPADSEFDQEALQARLLDSAIQLDGRGIAQVIADALVVSTVEEVVLDLIQPVLCSIGDGWQSGRLSVTVEHLASAELRAYMQQLLHINPTPLRSERFVVGSAPADQHDLGALAVALFLRRRGFDVIYVGASVEPQSLIEDVVRLSPAGVLLSATTVDGAGSLEALFRELATRYDGIRGFGGRAYIESPGLIERVPGTYLGPDAGSGVSALESLLTRRAA